MIFINSIFLNTTALKLALENNNTDIFNYLLSLPEIEIGNSCFKNCQKLKQFIVPSSAKFIGCYAFSGCKFLSDITIPSTLIQIGDFAFSDCKKLKNINIPSTVKAIGNNAFNNCISLKKMIIPSSVISIGDNFINKCYGLKKIKISSEVKNIGVLNFGEFKSLKKFIIPPCITKIYEYEFKCCSSLSKIEIPSSVTHIEKYAFYECTSLKQITIPPSVTSIEEGTFSSCTSLEIIHIPDSVVSIGINAFLGCKSLVCIKLPSSVNKIDFTAFKECTSLKKIIYNNDIKNIKIITELPDDFKVVFLGYTEVGKTCFIERYVENIFSEQKPATISLYTTFKESIFQGNKIAFIIWDTPGQEVYKSFTSMFIRNSKGAAVFFDISQPDTLRRADFYLEEVRDYNEEIPIVLVGNKCDLEHNVSEKDIKEFEDKYRAKYIKVSAKNGCNVEEVFNYLVTESFGKILEEKNRILNLITTDDENSVI